MHLKLSLFPTYLLKALLIHFSNFLEFYSFFTVKQWIKINKISEYDFDLMTQAKNIYFWLPYLFVGENILIYWCDCLYQDLIDFRKHKFRQWWLSTLSL